MASAEQAGEKNATPTKQKAALSHDDLSYLLE